MAEGIQTRILNADYGVATWDRALIHVWRGPMTMEALSALERVAHTFIAEQPKGTKIVNISIVERSSPPPAEHIRKELSRFFRDLIPNANEAIIVPEGGGFRAAIVRGVGVALSTFAPRAIPFKFQESVRAAALTAAPHLSPGAGGALALEDAIERVRMKTAGVGAHGEL